MWGGMTSTREPKNLDDLAQIIDIPYIHPKVEIGDIQQNGKLLSDAQIQALEAAKIANGAYSPNSLKNINELQGLKFPIVRLGNQFLAVYSGENKSVGEGSYGTVSVAQDVKTGDWYVVKRVHEENEDYVTQEVEMAQKVDQYRYHYEVGKNTYDIIMKLAVGSDLKSLEDRNMPTVRWVDIGLDTLKAFQEVHSKGIFHRDIKGGNIHFDAENGVTPLDWGFAEAYETKTVSGVEKKEIVDSLLGTIPFMAPELIQQRQNNKEELVTYNEQTEIYSLGMTLAEMYGLAKFLGSSDTLGLVSENSPDYKNNSKIPNPETRAKIFALLQAMTNPDPRKRPTLEIAIKEMERIRSHLLDLPSKISRVAYLDVVAYQKAQKSDPKALMEMRKELLAADRVYLVDLGDKNGDKQYIDLKQELARRGVSVMSQVLKTDKNNLAKAINKFSKAKEGQLDIFQNLYVTTDTTVDYKHMSDNNVIAVVATPLSKIFTRSKIEKSLKITDAHMAKVINNLFEERMRLETKYSDNKGGVKNDFVKQRMEAIEQAISALQEQRRTGELTYDKLLVKLRELQKQMNKQSYGASRTLFGIGSGTTSEKRIKETIKETIKEIKKEAPRRKI